MRESLHSLKSLLHNYKVGLWENFPFKHKHKYERINHRSLLTCHVQATTNGSIKHNGPSITTYRGYIAWATTKGHKHEGYITEIRKGMVYTHHEFHPNNWENNQGQELIQLPSPNSQTLKSIQNMHFGLSFNTHTIMGCLIKLPLNYINLLLISIMNTYQFLPYMPWI